MGARHNWTRTPKEKKGVIFFDTIMSKISNTSVTVWYHGTKHARAWTKLVSVMAEWMKRHNLCPLPTEEKREGKIQSYREHEDQADPGFMGRWELSPFRLQKELLTIHNPAGRSVFHFPLSNISAEAGDNILLVLLVKLACEFSYGAHSVLSQVRRFKPNGQHIVD